MKETKQMRNESKHNEYVSNFIFLQKKTYDSER